MVDLDALGLRPSVGCFAFVEGFGERLIVCSLLLEPLMVEGFGELWIVRWLLLELLMVDLELRWSVDVIVLFLRS